MAWPQGVRHTNPGFSFTAQAPHDKQVSFQHFDSSKLSDLEQASVGSTRGEAPRVLEEVFDDWVQNAEEMMADATELSTRMDDTIRFLEASMSCGRNRLLKLELGTEVATLAFALGALVSGIFGMNLKSGIEDAPGWFVTVVIMIAVAGVFIVAFSLWIIHRSKNHYQLYSAHFGNNKFFRSFADDSYILSLGYRGSPQAEEQLPGETLQRVLKDLSEPWVPTRTGCDQLGRRRRTMAPQADDNCGSGISSPGSGAPYMDRKMNGSNPIVVAGSCFPGRADSHTTGGSSPDPTGSHTTARSSSHAEPLLQ